MTESKKAVDSTGTDSPGLVSNNEFTSTGEKKPKTVAVSEDFMAFLHDALAEK